MSKAKEEVLPPGSQNSLSVSIEQQRNPHTQTVLPSILTLQRQQKSMFEFEKLTVYQKAKEFNSQVRVFIKKSELDRTSNDQLRKVAFSVVLNITEGTG